MELETVTNTAAQAATAAQSINWAQPSWDLFIILFFLVAGLLYGLSLGRDRIIVILVSIYMALAVVNTAPFIGLDGSSTGQPIAAVRVSGFLALFVVLFFILSRTALTKTLVASDSTGRWWQTILFSVLHVGLLVSITLSFLPVGAVEKLAPLTQKLFVHDTARFLWVVAPILAMVFLTGGGSREKKFKYDL